MTTTRIIYTSPSNRVFTYTTSYPVKINNEDGLIEFFDEKQNLIIKFPLDRCQIQEVR